MNINKPELRLHEFSSEAAARSFASGGVSELAGLYAGDRGLPSPRGGLCVAMVLHGRGSFAMNPDDSQNSTASLFVIFQVQTM